MEASFGYTPIYTKETPRYDFQRGGVPDGKRPYLLTEWGSGDDRCILLAFYDPTLRVELHKWREITEEWRKVELPSDVQVPLCDLAARLGLPCTL